MQNNVFKTNDEVYINIDDIVCIENENEQGCVYQECDNFYYKLTKNDTKVLTSQLGYFIYCSAETGRLNKNDEIFIYPDSDNEFKINSTGKWSLYKNVEIDNIQTLQPISGFQNLTNIKEIYISYPEFIYKVTFNNGSFRSQIIKQGNSYTLYYIDEDTEDYWDFVVPITTSQISIETE